MTDPDPLRAHDPDRLYPLDYARSICETHQKTGKPFSKELIKILVDELKSYVDGIDKKTGEKIELSEATAEKYIGLFDPKTKSKEKQLKKTERTRRREEPYQYALSCIPHYQTSDVGWKTRLAVELQHQFPRLKFLTAKSIVDKAYLDYEKVKDKEPAFKPTEKSISKVESTPSTSIETQVESHEEIESRLYSFALNFLFNFQDSGQKILRSELVKAITDYIEYHSLQYTEVQRLVDNAISEFREKSKTKPEFKTAYQELYKSEEKIALKPVPAHDLRIETTKGQEIDSVSFSKIDIKSDVQHDETLPQGTTSKKSKIDENHIFILKNIKHVEYPALLVDSFIQKTKKSRATFFRKLNQLERWGLILHVNQGTPRHYRLHPKLLNSSLKFLVVGEGTSLTFESTSQTTPIDEKPPLVQDRQSQVDPSSVSISAAAETEPCTSETAYHSTNKTAPISKRAGSVRGSKSRSQSHFEEIPSDSKELGGTSETRYDMTSKSAPISETLNQNEDSKSHSRVASVSNSSNLKTKPGTSETEPKSTSKTTPISEKTEESQKPAMDTRA
ncbi:MAG: hypothetical protein ACFE9L_18185 [Candidatus Hodarchaeota archaeon]